MCSCLLAPLHRTYELLSPFPSLGTIFKRYDGGGEDVGVVGGTDVCVCLVLLSTCRSSSHRQEGSNTLVLLHTSSVATSGKSERETHRLRVEDGDVEM